MSKERNAYRATDPAAVRKSLERFNEERTAFFERVEQFSRDHLDGIKLQVVGNGRGMWANHLGTEIHGETPGGPGAHWTPKGLMHRGDVYAEIPEGWHYYQKEREVRPYRGGRDKASKAAVQAVEDLNATSPGDLRKWLAKEFGVDEFGFGFEPVGDTYYVLLNPHRMITKGWDGNEHFEPVPMSTYWLDREAAEEAA